ncbi:hypothetical protein [Parasitella parasitica]|uniref:RNA helicase n=1 Tax=Parasitella parasitica TaxID=35722 RepID=A0A0B7NAZ8_9FUNG|nr:hypothetical protein [Parasitella parasitica]
MLDTVDTVTAKLGDLVTDPRMAADASPVNIHFTTKDVNPEDNLIKSTNTVLVKLANQQADPNSPLYSIKSFEELNLDPQLLKGLYSMRFSKPSRIQERALPLLMENPPKNMVGQSQSGTGKTAAFVLAMLSRVKPDLKAPQALCLAPSRELAKQIMDVVEEMSKFTNITTKLVVKDSLKRNEKVEGQVVVGTPGAVQGAIQRSHLPVQAIKMFVLDEADNMLDQDGLGDQSIRIKMGLRSNPQIVLFSATFPDHVRKFATKFAPDANEITLKREELSVDAIKQLYMDCDSVEDKYEKLCRIYDLLTVSQSIIFCKKRESADEIARRMIELGHSVESLHGKMLPEERDKTMDGFRLGKFKVLVTTNVIARGIDIPQVSLVINYDLPTDQYNQVDYEAYLHRIGRTGRFGRVGVSIILIHDKATWEQMNLIETHFQRPIAHVKTDDWDEVEKEFKKYITTSIEIQDYIMANSRRIKLITFDAYNTLFKPRGSLSAQYVEEAKKFGIRVTREQINRNFGQEYKKQLERAPFYGISKGMTPRDWWKELVYSTFLSAGIKSKDLDKDFDQLYNALYTRFTTAEAYSIFPDVLSTLDRLKQHGFHMGVISNSDERVVKVIENLNLNKYFEFVIASSLVECEKPSKKIYEKALELAGNVNAENALHVGDDVDKHINSIGATKAGWNAVLLERTKLSYEDFSPAMIADVCGETSYRPKQILTLHDLYSHISTLHSVEAVKDPVCITTREDCDKNLSTVEAAHAASHS